MNTHTPTHIDKGHTHTCVNALRVKSRVSAMRTLAM